MQEQTSIGILRRAREQIESAMDDDHPLNTLTQTIGRTLDHQIRWMSDLKNIVDEDEEEDFTLNESLRSIRRHFDELRRDKEQLTTELVRLEQTLRAEQDQAVTEKEYGAKTSSNSPSRPLRCRTSWQERFNDECARLRQHNSQVQSELDDQSRSFTDRLETLSRENSEYLQVKISDRFFRFDLVALAFDRTAKRLSGTDRSINRENTQLRTESLRRGKDETQSTRHSPSIASRAKKTLG